MTLKAVAGGGVAGAISINGGGATTDNALVRWDGITGTFVQNGLVTESDNGALTIPGATVTVSEPLINATQTWNAGAVTFTGLKLNVTATASAAASLLLDLQLAGASQFTFRKDGLATATAEFRAPSLTAFSNTGSVFWGTVFDVVLTRDAANTLALRNGATAQTFNLYGTFTDASNYERAAFSQDTTNGLIIATQKAGTGATRPISFALGATTIFQINTSGNTVWVTDNTYDIGASGATRPRRIYVGTGITLPGGAAFLTTSTALTDGAGVALGTLATAPSAGNPTKWIGINDNGTTRYIPAW